MMGDAHALTDRETVAINCILHADACLLEAQAQAIERNMTRAGVLLEIGKAMGEVADLAVQLAKPHTVEEVEADE